MNALARIPVSDRAGKCASNSPLVLVIEDEETQRIIIRAALERDGFNVAQAVDGLDGLQAFDRLRPDIVLLDVRMPGMDGFAVCEAMRRRPGTEKIPILMLTVLNDLESIERAYQAGATDFVSKPVAWTILGHRLRYMLRASQLFNELARSKAELVRSVADRTAELQAANAELRAANSELEAFAYSISHDLRSPLRAVRGLVGLLRDELGDSGEHELLSLLTDRTDHMSAMIDDLLRFSNISRGNDMKLDPVDLGTLAEQTINNLRADYPRTTIKVHPLSSAKCDATLMRHVFENLISNALKYSAKRNAPQVEIGMQRSDGEDIFFVRDNGAGFDAAHAPGLFGVFQRFHASSDFSGTGVGLAIVKRIVDRHRGRIWAHSTSGSGATFFFTLGEPSRLEGPPPI